MLRAHAGGVAGLIVALLCSSACEHDTHVQHEAPAQVEPIEGTDVSRVTLTEKAIERIDLKTVTISERDEPSASTHKIVPYSALLYDPNGGSWIYTSPEPRTFVRARVEVSWIEGDEVFLSDSPPVGTVIVSVGVAELYGTEFEVGH